MNPKKKTFLAILAFFALFVAACAYALWPGAGTWDKDPLGPYPSGDYYAAVKGIFSHHLKDPGSAVYSFNFPYRGEKGWMLEVGVNAKNESGAYDGEKYYRFVFTRGSWREVTP